MKNQYFDATSGSILSVSAGTPSDADRVSSVFVEFIAIDWFDCVHGDEYGVKKQVVSITPQTIPFVRDIANNFVIDVLFYLTPEFHHRISTFATKKLNYVYTKFLELNPDFKGNCSIIGHSLGSVITFDILNSQLSEQSNLKHVDLSIETYGSKSIAPVIDLSKDDVASSADNDEKILPAAAGKYATAYLTGHREQQLVFKPLAFYAIGSPIGLLSSMFYFRLILIISL